MVRMTHWPLPLWKKDINLGLVRVVKILEMLGNPHEKMPPVIHVAGTNGKGSTIAFLKAILEADGKKVHTYTSPHLVRFNERIKLAGVEITDDYLYQIMEEVRVVAEEADIPVTFFEGTTIGAFLAFSRSKADYVLLETGMGGRLDATNVVDNKLLTIITPISYDHMQYLGDTLDKIATEKAWIMRKDVPCVVAAQEDLVVETLEKIASHIGSTTHIYEYDYGLSSTKDSLDVYYISKDIKIELPKLALEGKHQYINAATAIQAALLLNIGQDQIIEGLKNAHWPGRLQLVNNGKYYEMLNGAEIWLDGAHNEQGASALAKWAAEKQDLPLYMIVGITKGRDCKNFLRHFNKLIKKVYGVTVESEPSSHKGYKVALDADELGFSAVSMDNVDDALTEIASLGEKNFRVLVTGSLFLVGEVLSNNINMRS